MPSTIEQLSPSRVKITIEVPFADLKPSLDKAYRQIAQQVTIPGFRKGKVPAAIIDQRFGRGAILSDAVNDALPEQYSKAIAEHSLIPLGQPEVEVTKLEDGDLVEFTADVVVRPDFDLPEATGVSVTVDPLEVDETLVDEQIKLLRQRLGSQNEVDRPAAEGDIVTIDLKGSKGGEALEDATAEGLQYTVGAGGMLDGLDEAVTGLSAGESATFTSTLVGGPLRGEDADIEVTVQKVSEQELPEVDDAFAQQVSQFETADEMRADLESRAEQMARLDQASKARDEVLEAYVAQIDLEVPESVVSAEVEARHNQITQQLAQAGLTLDQYLADSEEEQTAEEFWADIDARTAEALKAQLVLDKLAETSEIGVDQNDLTQHLMMRAQQNNTSPEQEAQHMMEHNHTAEWMSEIRRSKALAELVASAEVKDTEGNVVDLKNLRPDGTLADPAADVEAGPEVIEVDTVPSEPADDAVATETTDEAASTETADEAPAAEEKPKKAKSTKSKSAKAKSEKSDS